MLKKISLHTSSLIKKRTNILSSLKTFCWNSWFFETPLKPCPVSRFEVKGQESAKTLMIHHLIKHTYTDMFGVTAHTAEHFKFLQTCRKWNWPKKVCHYLNFELSANLESCHSCVYSKRRRGLHVIYISRQFFIPNFFIWLLQHLR